jgi:hypothetical protein
MLRTNFVTAILHVNSCEWVESVVNFSNFNLSHPPPLTETTLAEMVLD